MYNQKEAINVQVLYDLAVKREDVWADLLYKVSWVLYVESKLTDLDSVSVIYSIDSKHSEYCKYVDLPESMKQLTALNVCLIGRWFNELNIGKPSMMERFKLNCKPTDYWHETGIFKSDDLKCKNLEELIEKISNK